MTFSCRSSRKAHRIYILHRLQLKHKGPAESDHPQEWFPLSTLLICRAGAARNKQALFSSAIMQHQHSVHVTRPAWTVHILPVRMTNATVGKQCYRRKARGSLVMADTATLTGC
jgi:hypothetical protein